MFLYTVIFALFTDLHAAILDTMSEVVDVGGDQVYIDVQDPQAEVKKFSQLVMKKKMKKKKNSY